MADAPADGPPWVATDTEGNSIIRGGREPLRPFFQRGARHNGPSLIVRVKYEKGTTGLIYASSPDLTGLLVAEHTFDELETAIPQAITDLYAASGVNVVVTWANEPEEEGLVRGGRAPARRVVHKAGARIMCPGKTEDGHSRHRLHVKSAKPLEPYQ